MGRVRVSTRGCGPFPYLLSLCLLAFALRSYLLDRQSLWGDEAASLSYAHSANLLILLQRVISTDPHPPLYYALLHFWIGIAGDSDFAARWLSVAFGLLCIPMVYKIVARVSGDRRLPLLAAALTALSPFMVYYSQEARMYSMAAFLSLAFVYALLDAASRGGLRWVILSAGGVAALYTLSVTVALIPATCVFVGWGFLRRRPVASMPMVLGAFGSLIGMVASLVFWDSLQAGQVVQFMTGPDFSRFPLLATDTLKELLLTGVYGVTLDPIYGVSRAYLSVTTWEQVFQPVYTTLAAVLALALASYGTVAFSRRGKHAGLWLAAVFVVLVWGDAYILRVTSSKYASRVAFIAAPLFLLAVGLGVAALPGRALKAVAIIALLSGMGYSLWQNYENPAFSRGDYRSLATYLEQEMEPGDAVYLHGPPLRLLDSHYMRVPHSVYTVPRSLPVSNDWPEVLAQLQSLADRYPRLWLVLGSENDYDPGRKVEGWLLQHGYQVEDQWFGNIRLGLFIFPKSTGQEAFTPRKLGNVLDLVGSTGPVGETVLSGQGLALSFTWRLQSSRLEKLRLSLRLEDDRGQTWVQRDQDIGGYLNPTSGWSVNEAVSVNTGVRVPAGIPPGDYLLRGVVYGSSGQELTGGKLGEVALRVGLGPPTSAERLRPPARVDIALGPLKIIGYDLPQKVAPGEKVAVRLFWTAEAPVGEDYSLVLRLGEGPVEVLPLVPNDPTSRWRQGESLISQNYLEVAATASGRQTLTVGLDGRTRVDPVRLAQVDVLEPKRDFREATVQKAVGANLAGKAELIGLTVDGPPPVGDSLAVAPGRPMNVSLYWRGLEEMKTSYTVSVQLLDSEGRLVAQEDTLPARGQRPTTGWLPGEVISDLHHIDVPLAPPGNYTLIASMYDAVSGHRLETSEGDSVRLMGVTLADG
ncbi:MAG: glycosyltransferase family 39 protein [Dehalococcoidia bacterium]|nr:glycosyltransferase family 39 protein [Dehalococcoidia bacterium]